LDLTSSLSADTKDALARELPDAQHCRVALLAGLGVYGVNRRGAFVTHRNAVARLFRSLVRVRGDAAPAIDARSRAHRAPSFSIAAPDIADPMARRPTGKCDRLIEARAAFLACGSLAAGTHGYHLEFVVGDLQRAERLALMLRTAGREPKRMERKGRIVLYYKDFDAIADVLGSIGAFAAVLHLEDVRALRETKNRIHRLVNTEAANLERTAAAAAAQQQTIHFLSSAYGLPNLSRPLREITELRLAHPEESLAELGRRCNPEIGKPTVNSRLVSLAKLERKLRARPAGQGGRRRVR
jgi:hypothetical protein